MNLLLLMLLKGGYLQLGQTDEEEEELREMLKL